MRRLIVIFIAVLCAVPAWAQSNSDALEDQAREIGKSLRCVVCQNQSIEESDADLAKDMRNLVRNRLAEGDTPDEVIAFIRDRYGDYVLLKPPVQKNTYALWAGPALILLLALILQARRQKSTVAISELSDDEIEALSALRRELKDDPS